MRSSTCVAFACLLVSIPLHLHAATFGNGVAKYSQPALAALPSAPPSGTYTPASKDSPGLQAAINAAANAGGGTVSLASGNYTLNTPVAPKSRVHIVGAGQGVTFLNRGSGFAYQTGTTSPTWTGLLYASNAALSDVKFSALSVNGALSDTERAAQWPGFYGICIESDGTAANHNSRIQLSAVEIKNSGQGFECKGSTDITLTNGWYHNNGGGNLFFHNIYFRRCGTITVTGVTSNYSGGHGLKVAGATSNYPGESANLTVSGCSMNNNDYTGVYLTGMSNVRLANNTFNYAADLKNSTVSGGAGILMDQENSVKCSTVDIVNNTITNSYAHGIRIYSTDALNIQGNYCVANATANYTLSASNLTCDYNTSP